MSRNFKTSKNNRTNYIYYGIEGSKTVLIPDENGVTEAIIETLHMLDDKEFDRNRSETRKHNSLDVVGDKAEMVIDPNIDIEDEVFSKLESDIAKTIVRKALIRLKPQQQELIQTLYLSQKPISQAEYAERLGIEESSVSQKAWRAKSKLKAIIEEIKNNL